MLTLTLVFHGILALIAWVILSARASWRAYRKMRSWWVTYFLVVWLVFFSFLTVVGVIEPDDNMGRVMWLLFLPPAALLGLGSWISWRAFRRRVAHANISTDKS
jgi:hypothetical protein